MDTATLQPYNSYTGILSLTLVVPCVASDSQTRSDRREPCGRRQTQPARMSECACLPMPYSVQVLTYGRFPSNDGPIRLGT